MTATPKHRLRATVTYTLDYDPDLADPAVWGRTMRELAARDRAFLDLDGCWVRDDSNAVTTAKVEVIR